MDKEGEEEMVNIDPKKTRRRSPVVMTYIKGFSEQLRRTFRKDEVLAYFKSSHTQRQLLV